MALIKTIQFTVDVTPRSLQFGGKRMCIIGGKPRFFKNKESMVYTEAIQFQANLHKPHEPITGPIRLELELHMPRPKSLKDNASIMHYKRPDVDNMVKGIQDALSSFWVDDAQIYELRSMKLYTLPGEKPHINVRMTYGFLN